MKKLTFFFLFLVFFVLAQGQEIVGIGVRTFMKTQEGKQYLCIDGIVKDSPALYAQLQLGDIILLVDGFSCTNQVQDSSLARIRGKENSLVRIMYASQGNLSNLKTVEIVRKKLVNREMIQSPEDEEKEKRNERITDALREGHKYYRGDGVVANGFTAIEYYNKAVKEGDAEGYYWIGHVYKYGIGGVSEDYDKALTYYLKAAESNFKDAKGHAAYIYTTMKNEKAEQKAWDLAEEMEKDGKKDGWACYIKGLLYQDKKGYFGYKKADWEKEKQYFRCALSEGGAAKFPYAQDRISAYIKIDPIIEKASKGDTEAQYTLGLAFKPQDENSDEYDLEYHPIEALKWMEKAAAGGHKPAMASLAYYYEMGTGSGRANFPAAIEWYEKAIENGISMSEKYGVGTLYSRLHLLYEVRKEYTKAFALAQKQGDYYDIAYAYDKGEGISMDAEKALVYYQKAATEQGSYPAQEQIAFLNKQKAQTGNSTSVSSQSPACGARVTYTTMPYQGIESFSSLQNQYVKNGLLGQNQYTSTKTTTYYDSNDKELVSTISLKDGYEYVGNVWDNKPDGTGLIRKYGKIVYEGGFKEGRYSGAGIYYYDNGDRIEADWGGGPYSGKYYKSDKCFCFKDGKCDELYECK